MDDSYERHCVADPIFYETPARAGGLSFVRPAPPGWHRDELDDWVSYRPVGLSGPLQGWKIHVSACLDNAADTVAAVSDYCLPRRIPFKFLRTTTILLLRNGKAADRTGSGKFVTIYPANVAVFSEALTELGRELAGRAGPYILSDLRVGDGPLYVRYGGFGLRTCVGPGGDQAPAVADLTGRLVPDERHPFFHLPGWVDLPEVLAPHLAARTSTTVDELPVRIESALVFSNGGGIYRGVDRASGEQVVLKEARPHAGLSADGVDAVGRLRHEHDVLQRLRGLDVVPAVRGYFVVGDHEFLVMDHVEGANLNELLVDKYPLGPDPSQEERRAYASWALEVLGRVEAAVGLVHERGIVIGDLNPTNVLVRPDGRVVVIDWEVCRDVVDHASRRPTLRAPGFAAPAGTTGIAADRYALACLRLHLFLPLTPLLNLDVTKAESWADELTTEFDLPRGFLAEAANLARGAPSQSPSVSGGMDPAALLRPDPTRWPALRDSMAASIVASATPGRDDRLFPGDPAQFRPGGGLSLAHGAAGVLYALDAAGAGLWPEYENWLVAGSLRTARDVPLGLYDGLTGVAAVLHRLGRRREAINVLERCVDRLDGRWGDLGFGLAGGLAGIGLVLDHFAAITADGGLDDLAAEAVERVTRRLGDAHAAEHERVGLMRGWSGPALLLIRRYESTGDPALLDLAAAALDRDLERCVERPGGSLEVDDGRRTLVYLADGSVGIGLVMSEYLAHRANERFTQALDGFRVGANARFYAHAGLFAGRAGVMMFLGALASPDGGERRAKRVADPAIATHVRRLAWHAVQWHGNLAFPGQRLLRLSMDLATGTAGVLLALGAVMQETPVSLPFLASKHLRESNHAASGPSGHGTEGSP